MKTYNMEQRTPEWFEIRKGKMTASNAQAIGANGAGLKTYIYTLMAEKFSNNKVSFSNADTERGVELEENARLTYQIAHHDVQEVGFIEMDEFVGCSPDGLIEEDGGIEIKCVNDVNFLKLIVDGIKGVEITLGAKISPSFPSKKKLNILFPSLENRCFRH